MINKKISLLVALTSLGLMTTTNHTSISISYTEWKELIRRPRTAQFCDYHLFSLPMKYHKPAGHNTMIWTFSIPPISYDSFWARDFEQEKELYPSGFYLSKPEDMSNYYAPDDLDLIWTYEQRGNAIVYHWYEVVSQPEAEAQSLLRHAQVYGMATVAALLCGAYYKNSKTTSSIALAAAILAGFKGFSYLDRYTKLHNSFWMDKELQEQITRTMVALGDDRLADHSPCRLRRQGTICHPEIHAHIEQQLEDCPIAETTKIGTYIAYCESTR